MTDVLTLPYQRPPLSPNADELTRGLHAGRPGDSVDWLGLSTMSAADAAKVVRRYAEEALQSDPEAAAEICRRGLHYVATGEGLEALRARALFLNGDVDAAMRLADGLLSSGIESDVDVAVHLAATVLTDRGLMLDACDLVERSLALPTEADAAGATVNRIDCAWPALLHYAVGAIARGDEVRDLAGADRRPSLVASADRLCVDGVRASLNGSGAEALGLLLRAGAMAQPQAAALVTPEAPAVLAAVVALNSGELAIAADVLEHASTAAGDAPRARIELVQAWTALADGDNDTARCILTRVRDGQRLEARDELWAGAVALGLARRTNDVTALADAWPIARRALLRHPLDLFTLIPAGEYLLAAGRMGDVETFDRLVAQGSALLSAAGNPPLWSRLFHWSGVQAALLAQRPLAIEPHAAALVAHARIDPFSVTLAAAGRTWIAVLGGEIDMAELEAVTSALQRSGLAWDAARLAGQAAARATDRRDMVRLLELARNLQPSAPVSSGSAPTADQADSGRKDGVLSEREKDVARLLLAGRAYREIGSQLYISAKTVEHHVARMRKRLGATSRAELFTRLRSIVEPAGLS